MKSLVKTILIICAATVITTACSTDKLEIEQPGAITTNEYTIADDEGCKQFIAGVYSRVRGTATQWYLGSVDSYSGLNYKPARNSSGSSTSTNLILLHRKEHSKSYSSTGHQEAQVCPTDITLLLDGQKELIAQTNSEPSWRNTTKRTESLAQDIGERLLLMKNI